ncbi:MAG: sugar phosphate nucleotidyltransferase [Patescibacteria group bacterium]|nr:sugar phosphate nucleotidyltransferase [Patescibacteria group bacterium]
MKGVILAGGNATRLRPLTWVTNKHLLPIYNKPMIYYPLESMARAGIKEVLITTGPDHSGDFINLLRSGKDFGLKLSYEIQEDAGGLSQAVSLAGEFAGEEKILVILGDNIFKHNLAKAVADFEEQKEGAKVFGKRMATECRQYGVIEIKDGKVVSIEEKPENPKSDIAQTGIYMYDSQVFDFIKTLNPSARGELEITDLNNLYVKQGTMTCEIMEDWWVDAGTSFNELLRANMLVAEEVKKENGG